MKHLCVGYLQMADTPTPRSYRLPPLSSGDPQRVDPLREELSDMITILLDVKASIRSVRTDLEEIKGIAESAKQKPSLIPSSVRGALTTRNLLIAVVMAAVTAVLNRYGVELDHLLTP